jgi:seryl-tRNA(Sec) selenium transferase
MDNNTKAVLCVVKAMIERKELEGNRLQGWAINSAMNNIKAVIYEGGNSYVEMNTKGSMIQKQLVKLQHEGLTIHKGRDT